MASKEILWRQVEAELEANLSEPDALLKRIYAARGVSCDADLERDLKHLLSFSDLLGIESAVAALLQVLQRQQKILVVGDFDADGATSTVLALRALKSFGHTNIDYLVPNRFEYGYGLTPEIVVVAAQKNPELILTVDNGISSIAGVNAAEKLGIKVVITDHHIAGPELPAALAIVNPNQPNDKFASKNLAGVGVIFYLMAALRNALREQGWFKMHNLAEPNMANLLDLVALGTVVDVVTLDQNNRILVHQGLRRIQAGQCCEGIKALLTILGRKAERLVASDLGFVLGPRLNAAGRLDDMSLGIECLLTDDSAKALDMATELNALNQERRAIEVDMQQQVVADIEQLQLKNNLPVGVCLYQEDWHQGVVGILASRIKDRVNRPVIAFAKVADNEIKGSARSISGLHIRDVLAGLDQKNPGLITKFGGHAMAAGLSLPLDNYPQFCQAFIQELQQQLPEENMTAKVLVDGELSCGQLNIETAEMLRNAGPWGQGFPEPLFVGTFDVLEQRLVGKKHLRLRLQVPGVNYFLSAIAFNVDTTVWPDYRRDSLRAVYRLDINEYRGNCSLQLVIQYLS